MINPNIVHTLDKQQFNNMPDALQQANEEHGPMEKQGICYYSDKAIHALNIMFTINGDNPVNVHRIGNKLAVRYLTNDVQQDNYDFLVDEAIQALADDDINHSLKEAYSARDYALYRMIQPITHPNVHRASVIIDTCYKLKRLKKYNGYEW